MINKSIQIYLHIILAVKNKKPLIADEWEKDLYNQINKIIKNRGHLGLAINGMPDHLHILIGYNPKQGLVELLDDIKDLSSEWINESGLVSSQFNWQKGFGVFSYSKSQIETVVDYIANQEKHHQKTSFNIEYERFLKHFTMGEKETVL